MDAEALAAAIRAEGGANFAPALHAWLQAALQPDSTVMLAFGEGPPLVLFRHAQQARVFARLEAGYLAGAYLLDPFHALHLGRAGPGVYRLRDIAPDGFARSRYQRDYYRDTTLVDEVALLARPQADRTVMICLGRDAASNRAFDAAELALCHGLAPVAIALAERHWRDLSPSPQPGQGPDVAARLIRSAERSGIRLSPRQAEVALMILRGHSTASIALGLGLSAQTVKVFRRQLYGRCGLSSQAELFALMLPMLAEG